MSGNTRTPVKDAPIRDEVNVNAIQTRMQEDNFVAQFAKEGAKLLKETNKPNVVTLEQFQPFIPMFNMDIGKYRAEMPTGPYYLSMNRLYNQYIRGLGINLYEPTIIIYTIENPVELAVLPRRFTRLLGDSVDKDSARNTIPAAVRRSADRTRDQMILDASLSDLVKANQTPEQMKRFRDLRMESALILKAFVERNMTPEKRQELINKTITTPKPVEALVEKVIESTTFLDDDDD